jgi:hypothetical protein
MHVSITMQVYSGGIGSYALLVMVAAFLQSHVSRTPLSAHSRAASVRSPSQQRRRSTMQIPDLHHVLCGHRGADDITKLASANLSSAGAGPVPGRAPAGLLSAVRPLHVRRVCGRVLQVGCCTSSALTVWLVQLQIAACLPAATR